MTRSTPCCSELERWLSPTFFKALSDPTRVAVLAMIAEQNEEKTVSQIAQEFPVDLSVISRHLSILRDAGMVESARRGKQVYYRVRLNDLVGILRNLADALESCCPSGVCSKG